MSLETGHKPEKTSFIIKQLLAEHHGEKITIDELVTGLRRRSFGGLFVSLAIVGLIPGISFLIGILLIVPGIQMLLGYPNPVFPKFVREKTIEKEKLQKISEAVMPWIERLETYVKPRYSRLTGVPAPQIVGAIVIALSLILMVPLPFSNFPPALAITLLSLGLMERDGVLIVLGFLTALSALLIGIAVISVTLASVSGLLSN